MKISLKWISDYVQLPADAAEVARRLTAAGLEVEGLSLLGGVVVGQIRESVHHPDSDKLSVTQVDAGRLGAFQVVCGAKNFQVGDKVALATVGTVMLDGLDIKKASLRGVESFGMLCSARELGLAKESSGLHILPADLPLGTPVVEAEALSDTVLEVNVTPNRPDALSHLGVARELSVLLEKPLTLPAPGLKESGSAIENLVQVKVEDAARCPRYAARVIEGVKVQASPAWLQRRLKICGVRAINNVVDVTNYVLLEYGQPLHAFDLDRVEGGKVVVRQAREGEKLATLDAKVRTLSSDDLVIADSQKALALAGVMGGSESEVGEKTTRILLESAHFQPSSVRRSSKRHALHTEASHRFERGTDWDAVPSALDRAAALIAELGQGTVASGQLDVQGPVPAARQVTLRWARLASVLGVEIAPNEGRRILSALGFISVKDSDAASTYAVPRARVDVDQEEDLIEEVARVHGYDNIPARLPRGVATLSTEPVAAQVERRIREALAGAGLDEVLNYSFVAPERLAQLGEKEEPIRLLNPLSVEQSAMRTTLLGGLLENLSLSVRHQVENVRLYEMGRVYLRDAEGGQGQRAPAREVARVAGVLWGLRAGKHWTEKDVRVDFFDAKGALEAVLAGLRLSGAVTFKAGSTPAYHPRACAELSLPDGRILGHVGEMHPRVTKALGLPASVFAFELDMAPLEAAFEATPQAKPLPRFPAVLRDLAVVVPVDLAQSEVREVIFQVGGAWVEDVLVFDVYTGKPIPEGKKNLAFALRYRSSERTLTDAEVASAHQQIVAEVDQRFGAALRS